MQLCIAHRPDFTWDAVKDNMQFWTTWVGLWHQLTWDVFKDYMPLSLTWDAQSLSALVTWVAGSYFGNQPPGAAGGDRHAPSTSAGTNLNRENCQNFLKLTFCQIANWPVATPLPLPEKDECKYSLACKHLAIHFQEHNVGGKAQEFGTLAVLQCL